MRTFKNVGMESAKEIGKHWGVWFDFVLEAYGFKLADEDHECAPAFNLIRKNFEQVDIQDVLPGDIVVYHDLESEYREFKRWGNPEHFGIIYKASNEVQDIRVQSQWGYTKTYRHFLGAVPNIYGQHVTFWRAKDKTFSNRSHEVFEEIFKEY